MKYLTDEEFIAELENCRLPNESFRHRDHLRLAWIYLRRHGKIGAPSRIAQSIRRYATHHGKPERYHETITQAWLVLMSDACAGAAEGSTFECVLAAFPPLLEKDLLAKFYSRELLQSDAARASFVAPDLAPLPVT
ncbi:MAG TPA: hypothetical protein VGH38_12845 [Bryobacteraceae bacterium]|jgi:hypothetical protein